MAVDDAYATGYETPLVVLAATGVLSNDMDIEGDSLTATADVDSEFAGWSGDVVGTSNPVSVTMTGDVTVTATFTQGGYRIYLPLVVRNG